MTRRNLETYNELRARHPQLPDPRWIACDSVRIELEDAPLITVELTLMLVDPATRLELVDLSPIGYPIPDPDEPLPIHDEAAWLVDSRRRAAEARLA